jgi:3-oxoacyl-[acyl-carrier-protein] synthase-3
MNLDYYLPEKILTNTDLSKEFQDWNFEDFEKKIGIKQRHIAQENETALDMAEKACLKVLDKIDRSKIDFIILCTQSPDYFLPTSACILQNRLNLTTSCGALDINLGCSGYIYGLSLAKGLLASRVASNILLVVSETYSKHLHPKDRANRAIFGDAAVATYINEDNLEIGEFILGTQGKGFEELIVKNGGTKNKGLKIAEEYEYGTGNITSDDYLYMNGPGIYNFTISTIPSLVSETAKKNSLTLDEIDFFIFHQANEYMLNYLRRKSQIPTEKFCIDMALTGNTVSATIPIALKNAISNKKIQKGNKVMLVGFGVGLSWGATIITIK